MTTIDYSKAEARSIAAELKLRGGRDYTSRLLGLVPGMALNDLVERMQTEMCDLEDADEPNEFDRAEDC